MGLRRDVLEILQETSRTFYIPIICLPPGLQEAVASAYLCMRAIDEIEAHPGLDNSTKVKLLRTISLTLQAAVDGFAVDDFSVGLSTHYELLPKVTTRIGEWALLAPVTIAPRIWDATAGMAERMAYWAQSNWKIRTESDLDRYTFGVAGAFGLLLADLWAWYDGTNTNRADAIWFARGLQAVNILRNHNQDLARGVNFFPEGWSSENMRKYAQRNLALAEAYNQALSAVYAREFCQILIALAYATLNVLAQGEEQLSRSAVLALIEQVTSNAP